MLAAESVRTPEHTSPLARTKLLAAELQAPHVSRLGAKHTHLAAASMASAKPAAPQLVEPLAEHTTKACTSVSELATPVAPSCSLEKSRLRLRAQPFHPHSTDSE